MKYFLAVDIGATSARHILAHYEGRDLKLEEIHRFKTPLVQEGDGHCHWDVDGLFSEILTGMKKAKEAGKIPSSMGIDCFGVDYALLDEKDERIGLVTSYRDVRTFQAQKEFMTPEGLFLSTGVYPQNFDSAYQLYCDKASGKLHRAKTLMMLPSYLCYLLTGKKQNELSSLSTSALLDARTRKPCQEVFSALGIEESLLAPMVVAGDCLGKLLPSIQKEVGFDCEVYATLEHDTAAAFFASGAEKGEALLSSGTWSLLGCLLPNPIITEKAYKAGFTNELSRPGEVRFLQNIMGMWIINRLKDELQIASFGEITSSAAASSSYQGFFDVTDGRLSNPSSMKECVESLLVEKGNSLPSTRGELFYSVYHSLALGYKTALENMERLTGEKIAGIRVFGGGVNAEILNSLTEQITGLPVKRGPSEATAIGNLLCFAR